MRLAVSAIIVTPRALDEPMDDAIGRGATLAEEYRDGQIPR
ncbi:hypothetical protein [Rhodococcus opacus]|nr:hypothetical protein [Rhodococcus opacus]